VEPSVVQSSAVASSVPSKALYTHKQLQRNGA
jgi:hypothetical protein